LKTASRALELIFELIENGTGIFVFVSLFFGLGLTRFFELGLTRSKGPKMTPLRSMFRREIFFFNYIIEMVFLNRAEKKQNNAIFLVPFFISSKISSKAVETDFKNAIKCCRLVLPKKSSIALTCA
jgi:hypothetical protein